MSTKCYRCGRELSTADGYGFNNGLCASCYYTYLRTSYSDNTMENVKYCDKCGHEIREQSK